MVTTKISAATFSHENFTTAIRKSFLLICVSKYTGFLFIDAVDQGPQFQLNNSKSLLHAEEITDRSSECKIHHALDVEGRCQSFLCKLVQKTIVEDNTEPTDTARNISVKTMNDTARTSAIVPTLLGFGALLHTLIRPVAPPTQEKVESHARDRKEIDCGR